MIRWLRRLLPARQVAACSTCGLVLRERRRKSCPVCGSTRRTVSVGMEMAAMRGTDKMG